MIQTFITYAQRTAIGKIDGALAQTRVDDLLAHLLSHFKSTCPFPLEQIDDVIIGCANQAGEDNRNLARMAVLLAHFPYSVPGVTINRLCASSLDALIDGHSRIQSNLADAILVGGAENMSRAPYVLSKAEKPFDRGQKIWDTSLGWRFPNPQMEKLFPLFSMGETAEEVSQLLNITREDQDQFALKSHQQATFAIQNKYFKNEIVPLTLGGKVFDTDEGPRLDTNLEKLATLKPLFRKNGSVTAGNSSTLNDGAALLMIVSEKFLKQYKLKPLAQITGMGIKGCHPNTMGLGPVEAVNQLCHRFQQKISDFDSIEINEAFAAQVLGCIRELKIDAKKVNTRGGAIALGHPLGCSGARIVTSLIHQMLANPAMKKGLATMCVGLGQGVAVSLERC